MDLELIELSLKNNLGREIILLEADNCQAIFVVELFRLLLRSFVPVKMEYASSLGSLDCGKATVRRVLY